MQCICIWVHAMSVIHAMYLYLGPCNVCDLCNGYCNVKALGCCPYDRGNSTWESIGSTTALRIRSGWVKVHNNNDNNECKAFYLRTGCYTGKFCKTLLDKRTTTTMTTMSAKHFTFVLGVTPVNFAKPCWIKEQQVCSWPQKVADTKKF